MGYDAGNQVKIKICEKGMVKLKKPQQYLPGLLFLI